MKKYLGSIFIFLVLVGGVLVFAIQQYYNKPKLTTSNRYLTLEYSTFDKKVTFSGVVVPIREAKIVAPYSGYIKKLYVKVGQTVKKRDPLVSIVESLHADEKVYPMRAPYQGVVVSINHVEGEYVRMDDTSNPIVTIDDLHKFYIEANVPELDVLKLKVGQKARIQVLPIADKKYEGIVLTVDMTPKSRRGSYMDGHVGYPIKIEILNPDKLLKSGMSAVVNIIIDKKESVLALPHEFVLKDGSKYYVILKDGQKIPVKIGSRTGDKVIIKSGVPVGSLIQQVDYFDDDKDGADADS